MKIAILTLGSPGAGLLADAAKALGHQVVVSDFNDDASKRELYSADIFLPRISPASFKHAIELLRLYGANNPTGVAAVSEAGVGYSFDKFDAYTQMVAANIPTPRTFLIESVDELAQYNDQLPLIIKPRSENQGRNIYVARTEAQLQEHVTTLLGLYGSCIIQDFIDVGGRDIRGFVLGDQVVAAMERRAPEGSDLANLSKGGTAEPIDLSPEETAVCLQAAQLFGTTYAGVDLLRTADGPQVLEVNVAPGLKISKVTRKDIPSLIIKYLVSKREGSK